MDKEFYDFLLMGTVITGAFVGIVAVSKHYLSHLKHKHETETYVERVHADMAKEKQAIELGAKRLELMASAEYKAYQDRRFEAFTEFKESISDFENSDPKSIKQYLDNIVGTDPLEPR